MQAVGMGQEEMAFKRLAHNTEMLSSLRMAHNTEGVSSLCEALQAGMPKQARGLKVRDAAHTPYTEGHAAVDKHQFLHFPSPPNPIVAHTQGAQQQPMWAERTPRPCTHACGDSARQQAVLAKAAACISPVTVPSAAAQSCTAVRPSRAPCGAYPRW